MAFPKAARAAPAIDAARDPRIEQLGRKLNPRTPQKPSAIQAARPAPRLTRKAFGTSRLAEFASNARRFDRHLGSFKVNRHNGGWAQFTTGDEGRGVEPAWARSLPRTRHTRSLCTEPEPPLERPRPLLWLTVREAP
jgi:hypothetical protein